MKNPAPEEVLYDGSSGDPTVIAYDPGGVTGWALFSVHPDALIEPDINILPNVLHFSCGQFIGSEREIVDQMLGLAREWAGAASVLEDFILRVNTMSRDALSPVRISAAFNYSLGPAGRTYLQQPALAKTTMTDERLKLAGYFERTVGRPHARDAVRHGLTFLRRMKDRPSLLASAFPALVR